MSSRDVWKKMGRNEARKLASEILKKGSVGFSKHARKRMAERNLTSNDVLNVVRCGRIHGEPEEEAGSWRYCIETEKMAVVVAFRSGSQVAVVTCWRKS